MATSIARMLLIAGLTLTGTAFADGAIQVGSDYGNPVARFKVGDSHCVLKNDQITCTPVNR